MACRAGRGIGSYWGNLRSIGERVGSVGKTSGVVPFIRVMDSLTLAISQGSLRRGVRLFIYRFGILKLKNLSNYVVRQVAIQIARH